MLLCGVKQLNHSYCLLESAKLLSFSSNWTIQEDNMNGWVVWLHTKTILFHEENVNFDNIDDPLTRNATFAFINNFGQIPTQLFKKPHPKKNISQLVSAASNDKNVQATTYIQIVPGLSCPKVFYHALESLRPSRKPVKGEIVWSVDRC